MQYELNKISEENVKRKIDRLKRLIAIWDSENENALPVKREDVIENYFVTVLREVSDLDIVDFVNEFYRLYDNKEF